MSAHRQRAASPAAANILAGWLFCISAVPVQGQQTPAQERFIHLSAGLGVDALATSSLVDYMNDVTGPPDRLSIFSTGVEFFVTPELQIADAWSVALDYSLLINSRTIDGSAGRWEFTSQTQLPTAMVHYLVGGSGYWLKAGGGLGYHWMTLRERFVTVGSETDFTASGIGLKLDAVANTAFDSHLLGSVAVELRWSSLGTLRAANGSPLQYLGREVNMDFYSAGVKFGLTYQL